MLRFIIRHRYVNIDSRLGKIEYINADFDVPDLEMIL